LPAGSLIETAAPPRDDWCEAGITAPDGSAVRKLDRD
jgi:hypothetical protein